ncbi:hypothetical protein ACUXST_000990 [Sphingomonas sp. F9_3S_D5_B_2]
MITLFVGLAAAAQAKAATPPATPVDADPVICQRDNTSEVGTHMKPKKICMKRSDWDIVEKQTHKELQSLRDRNSFDPGRAEGHRP